MPYYLVADSFYTKKLCSTLSSSKLRFYPENGRFAFLAPFGGLGATYGDHLRLIGKRVVVLDFLIVLIELFFASRPTCNLRLRRYERILVENTTISPQGGGRLTQNFT